MNTPLSERMLHYPAPKISEQKKKEYQPFSRELLSKHTQRVMRKLFKILGNLYKHRMVHRKVMPENILFRMNKKNKPDIILENMEHSLPEDPRLCGIREIPAPLNTIYTLAPEHHVMPAFIRRSVDQWGAGVIFASLLLNDDPRSFINNGPFYKENWGEGIVIENGALHQIEDLQAQELLLRLIAPIPERRYFPKMALKHKYFKKKHL